MAAGAGVRRTGAGRQVAAVAVQAGSSAGRGRVAGLGAGMVDHGICRQVVVAGRGLLVGE